MNKYAWSILLIFSSLTGTSLSATTINFRTLTGSQISFKIEDKEIPSLTFDSLVDSMVSSLKERKDASFYSSINKSDLNVIFQAKNIAHPHNFMKWKESLAAGTDGILYLLRQLSNSNQNTRQIRFWDKVHHKASWAHHADRLNIPADASMGTVKQILLENLKLQNSISLNDIKLFRSYESDIELSEDDLQNESILSQGISFSFTSLEKKTSIALENAPAAIRNYYPNGLSFKIKQFYTTIDDVRSRVAKVLNIKPNHEAIKTLEVNLQSDAEPFTATVSFKKPELLDHMDIQTNIKVLEIVDGKVKSSTYKHHNFLAPSPQLTVHKFVENLLAPEGLNLEGKIATSLDKAGRTILNTIFDSKAQFLFNHKGIVSLDILVVPEDWQEIDISFVRFDDNAQKLVHIDKYWLPVADPELWRFALVFQDHSVLKDYYRSAQYVPAGKEIMPFHGKNVCSEPLAPFAQPTCIKSLKIHLNPMTEELYQSEHAHIMDLINQIFEISTKLDLAANLKNALATVDPSRFSNIHYGANQRLSSTLSAELDRLNDQFTANTHSENVDILLKIHTSYCELIVQMPINCNLKKFNQIRDNQASYIQKICEDKAMPSEPQPFTYGDYQNLLSSGVTRNDSENLLQLIWDEPGLTAEEKNSLITKLMDLSFVDEVNDFSALEAELKDLRKS